MRWPATMCSSTPCAPAGRAPTGFGRSLRLRQTRPAPISARSKGASLRAFRSGASPSRRRSHRWSRSSVRTEQVTSREARWRWMAGWRNRMAERDRALEEAALAVAYEFIAAWNANDMNRVLALMDENVRYHNMPVAPLDGKAAVAQYLASKGGFDWI